MEYQALTKTIVKLRSALRSACKNAGITSQDAVLLCVSGGADSMALALSAAHVCKKLQVKAYTITVNHNIRTGSLEEAEHVANTLSNFGFDECFVESVNINYTQGPEASARLARYDAIVAKATQLQAQVTGNCYIFTAHTLNDQAETVLLRLARGSGLNSLSGIHPQSTYANFTLIRPFLEVSRTETEQCCADFNVDYVIDETNFLDGSWRADDGSALRRVAIRHQILPALKQALGQDVIHSLAKTAQLAREDNSALDFVADEYLSQLQTCTSNSICLDKSKVSLLPVAVRRRIYRLALLKLQAGDYSSKHLQSIDSLLNSDVGSYISLPKGITVVLERQQLVLHTKKSPVNTD